MGLETANYVNQLIDTNPTGADPASSSDDHHRLVKKVLKQTFPNLTGPMTATQAQLNTTSTPRVAQGTGPGQGANNIAIGWTSSSGRLRASVDVTDLGEFLFDSNLAGARGEFYAVTPPQGWLKANGAVVSRTVYERLFNVIGTNYGAGDGSTTFNLPNDQGLFARGWDESGIYDPGRAFGSVQGSQNLAHSHGGVTNLNGSHAHGASTDAQGGHTHSGTTQTAGSHSHGVPQNRVGGGGGAYASLKSEDAAGVDVPTSTAGSHTHTLIVDGVAPHAHTVTVNAVGEHQHGIPTDGGAEARPINRAVLVCIKY
jgi:microcystin-dependent protein